ncbi:GPI anchored serine-threonine rich protein [Talaromyces stipitatus ATCC 10500]|uniref:GPI anchored serine-threonine rich protein n=1 Tax=Talaromyces stipitatus (strain ATCC 10500 / CBS 375.48 / QM 6759 / NRRL 1006) TaxID=441959 RepID=B8MFE4_TALSN|nr:GPI anchored serine-threonine rich protein [Talaromyces stipitatus ATCC 10500]EED16678.1 GPI anchored serine-threonine rich protein [Talaromyces stipitatus ATCC 10500]
MKFLAVAAGLVATVSAYTYPTPFNPTASGAGPSGNPIYLPDTSSPVTLGEAYKITWEPTTPGPIALVLCKGPSTDCEPMLTVAEKVPNSGEFTWTPSGLDPSATSTGGYGIMLIDWTTEAYQYTTQFGVLAGKAPVVSASASSSTAPAASATPSTTTVIILPSSSAVIKPSTTPVWSTVVNYSLSTTVICPESTKLPLGTGTVSVPWATSTGSPSVPTSVPNTVPAAPKYTGAADRNMVSYGTVGAIAGLAALLAF